MINQVISIAGSRLLVLATENIRHDQGFAYHIKLPADVPPGDCGSEPYLSKILLFENGTALWPPHSTHDDIRNIGKGLYSHYGSFIYFSASDNSSPLTNARRYEIFIPGAVDSENKAAADADQLASINVPAFKLFCLARDSYRQIWPYTRLPDIGRLIDNDQDFAAGFHQVSPEADYTYERKFNLDQLFKLVLHVEGDVAECGTYKGSSAFFMARHIIGSELNKHLCLFDSFQGLSAPADMDGDWWTQGDLAGSIDDVKRILQSLGDTAFVEFYPGWIPERFGDVSERRFCFVHIDVDLAQPTKASLAFFYPRLSKGAVMLFDDYGFDSCPGVTQVVDEFMADKREPLINLSAGGAFFIKD